MRIAFLTPVWVLVIFGFFSNLLAKKHKEEKALSSGCCVLFLLLVFSGMLWALSDSCKLFLTPMSPEEKAQRMVASKDECRDIARRYIKSRLRNPDAADFGWGLWGEAKEIYVPEVGDCVQVCGHVTGENLLGGKTRQYFEVTIEPKSGDVIHFYSPGPFK